MAKKKKPLDQTAREVHYRQLSEWLKHGTYAGIYADTNAAMDDGSPFDTMTIDELHTVAFRLTLLNKGEDIIVPTMEIIDLAHYPSPAPCPTCASTLLTIVTYAATDYANRDTIRTDVRCRKCGIMLRQRIRNQRTGDDVTDQHAQWKG
jgi:hypothetical protein